MSVFQWRLDGFSQKYISLYLYLGLFLKTGKTRVSHQVKMMTRWPERERWPKWPMDPGPNDPVPCLVTTCCSTDSERTHRCCRPTKTWAHAGYSLYFTIDRGLPSVLWQCWLGVMKSIRPVKIEWWGVDVVICLKSVLSLLRRLSTWRCPHCCWAPVRPQYGACSAPAAVDRYLLLAWRWAANPPAVVAAVDRWDRQTDGPLYRPRTDLQQLDPLFCYILLNCIIITIDCYLTNVVGSIACLFSIHCYSNDVTMTQT